MTWAELLNWVGLEDERTRKLYGGDADDAKWMFVRMTKITEEVGELADEVLAFNAMQRQAKLVEDDPANLSAEIADVLLTTLLLAKVAGVDVPMALKNKMTKVDKRYEVAS